MLNITIPKSELFDENTSSFIYVKEQHLQLEHSLVSLDKWESKWKIPFLGKDEKTREQTIDYIRCMTITQNVSPEVYYGLTEQNFLDVTAYIDDSMTATWFSDDKKKPGGSQVITSELLYYWMIAFNIPFECRKWHLNKLLTLIHICNIKNQPPKKLKGNELAKRNASINNARRKALGTTG